MMKSELPSFSEASSRFLDFLEGNGFPGEVLWLFREDVMVTDRGQLWIRLPIPEENLRLAQAAYDRGCAKGPGVKLEVFCVISSAVSCAFVSVPCDQRTAELDQIQGLKMSVPERVRQAKPYYSTVLSRIRLLFAGPPVEDPWVDELPCRKETGVASKENSK